MIARPLYPWITYDQNRLTSLSQGSFQVLVRVATDCSKIEPHGTDIKITLFRLRDPLVPR